MSSKALLIFPSAQKGTGYSLTNRLISTEAFRIDSKTRIHWKPKFSSQRDRLCTSLEKGRELHRASRELSEVLAALRKSGVGSGLRRGACSHRGLNFHTGESMLETLRSKNFQDALDSEGFGEQNEPAAFDILNNRLIPIS